MTKKKKKLFIVILSVLILILACFFGVKAVYKSYFAPKVSVTSINSNIELNDWNLTYIQNYFITKLYLLKD